MRDFKGMKRQRGRNRKPNNNANNANPNRSWDSQGPENIKVRGNAQTVYERYQQLARDASSGGDRVLAENYMQHAEHYFRVLRALQPQRPVSEIAARELSNQGFDIDFEDETGAQAAAFLAAQQAADRAAQGQQGEGQGGEQRPYRDRDQNPNQNREWREREPREAREPREDNGEPRTEGEGGRRETRRERWERRQQERNRRFEAEGPSADSEASPADPAVEAQVEPPVVETPVDTPPADTRRPARARRPRASLKTSASDDDAPTALPGFLTRAPAPSVAAHEDGGEDAAPRRRAPRRKIEAPADSDG